MPSIVGIDTSLTSTGLCRVDFSTIGYEDSWSARCATVKSTPKGKSYLDMSVRIGIIADRIVNGSTADGIPDLVVIEGPAFNAKGAHTHSRDWLWGRVFDGFVRQNIPILVATPSSRMKYATGKGNAAKDQVLAAAIKRWPTVDITGNDTADALILAAIGCRHLGVPIDAMPVAHHVGPGKLSA